MKDNTFKIIIVVCMVAIVGILGVAVYSFINTEKAAAANATTQSLQNNSNNLNTTNHSNLITPQQALAIANKYASQSGEKVVGLNAMNLDSGKGMYSGGTDGDPFYHISVTSINPNQHIEGYVEVDAITGAINPRSNTASNGPISLQEAINVVKQNLPMGPEVSFGDLYNGTTYTIFVQDENPGDSTYGQEVGRGYVDAKTGQYLGGSGW